MYKKVFIFLIKYIPVIQMAGILFSNILYLVGDYDNFINQLDIIIGNSYTHIFIYYICSYLFGFCKWHRLIITANLCSLILLNADFYFNLPNLNLILSIFTIDIIFLFIIIINKFKCKH